MNDSTDLTVSAWIRSTSKAAGMRVVSKDEIGEPGNFVLLHNQSGQWTMRVWDDRARTWQLASWQSKTINDGEWHQLLGVVDSALAKVLLYVDGELKAGALWTADSLEDSNATDLVVGADSGKHKFGHTFKGSIRDAHIYPLALKPEQIASEFKTLADNL